jgi:acyl-CoA dehydrogenase
MEIGLDEERARLARQVRSWTEAHPVTEPSGGADLDEEARLIVALLGSDGILAHAVPREHGGVRERVQARDLCVIRECLARASALADGMFAVQALGSYPIALAASAEQKARYLPPLARGERVAAFALTEPGAGSDVSALATTAVKQDSGYILNGVKHFISNAGTANTYVVFASTDPQSQGRGISAFIVEDGTPGFFVKEKTTLLSPHPIGAIGFSNCRVDESRRLGAEGDGLKIAFTTLDLLRCTVGAAAVGFAERALEAALAHSRSRRQFGRALADFQATQMKLAEMATELEAARLLVYRAAAANDASAPDLVIASSMAKLYATEAAQRIVDQAVQIHGAAGIVAGHPVERLYRDVRALRIYEGTSEIQKLVIAKQLLKKEAGNGL